MPQYSVVLAAILVALPQVEPPAGHVRRTRARDASAPKPDDRKSKLLRAHDERVKASDAPLYGEGPLRALPARIAALPADASVAEEFPLRVALADALLIHGDIEASIEQYERCRALAIAERDAEVTANMTRYLAIAWMRLGERENCVTCHTPESCIFPLQGAAVHAARRGSERAMKELAPLLKADRGDLMALWLYNVAAMTLGLWPEKVEPAWRLASESFAPDGTAGAAGAIGRFPESAAKYGFDTFSRAGGSVMDDFDGDGLLDVLVSSSSLEEPLGLFRQERRPERDGEGRSRMAFRDVSDAAGLSGQVGGLQCFAQDFDNDGRLDVLVQRGAWIHRHGAIENSLLMQQPDGTFVDRTLEAGVEVAQPSQVAAFADVDLDGDLDLFLGGESMGAGTKEDYPCRLLRNRGDATFEDVTAVACVSNDRFTKGATFGDYDGDRYPDLYVSNLGQPNRLYHNQRDGTFVDVAESLGVALPIQSFSCFFFDHDDDGWLDLWVSCYATPRTRGEEMTAWHRERRLGADTMRLYRNDGAGRFRDVTRESGLARVVFPMGSNFGDVDGDGFPDLYLATGDPEYSSLWPNVMLRNGEREPGAAGRRFLDVTVASGTGHLQKGHGVSFGDLDGDGDQDLFVETGGVFRDDAFQSALFENPGHGNRWLTVRLIGRESNRFGVGARIRATIEEGEESEEGEGAKKTTRDVFHFVGTNSSFGGNSLQAELGLGKARRIVALEVAWPRTGMTQRFADVPLDRVVVVDEGRPKLDVLDVLDVRPPAPASR